MAYCTGVTFTSAKSACPDLTQWRDAQKIQSVSLVFASGYMSNPALCMPHVVEIKPRHRKTQQASITV